MNDTMRLCYKDALTVIDHIKNIQRSFIYSTSLQLCIIMILSYLDSSDIGVNQMMTCIMFSLNTLVMII